MNKQLVQQEDGHLEALLQQEAHEIRSLLKKSVADIVAIGTRLLLVKEQLKSTKKFYQWCQQELGISAQSSENFTNVAKFTNTHPNIGSLDPTTLYALAAPKTPPEIVEGVATGRIEPTLSAIQQAKRGHQEKPTRELGRQERSSNSTIQTTQQAVEQILNMMLEHLWDSSEAGLQEVFERVLDQYSGEDDFADVRKNLKKIAFALAGAVNAIR